MSIIDSPANQHIRLMRSLATAKGRREHGLFPVEGLLAVQEMAAAGVHPEYVFLSTELLGDQKPPPDLLETAGAVLELSPRAFKALSDTVTPQGIAAAAPIRLHTLDDLAPKGPLVVPAAVEMRDPGNLGTMIRTANAAGAAALFLVGDCVDAHAPKVVRATMGAIFRVPLIRLSVQELCTWAVKTATTLAAADARAAHGCHETVFPPRTVLLIGNEAHGLPPALLTAAALHVRIPMPGPAESLNAAVAAGILLYELNRQRS